MIEWFKNLTNANKIAIIVPITLALIGGLFGLSKLLFLKKDDPSAIKKTIQQTGIDHTAANINGSGNIVAGGDVSTGIDSDVALNMLVTTSRELSGLT